MEKNASVTSKMKDVNISYISPVKLFDQEQLSYSGEKSERGKRSWPIKCQWCQTTSYAPRTQTAAELVSLKVRIAQSNLKFLLE